MSERRGWWQVLFLMTVVGVLASCLMFWWGRTVVDTWAGRARHSVVGAAVGELRNYAVPGAFGDSFAPIVGFLTSLALGAAIASVLMQREELQSQREEMRLAREQYERQSLALDDANRHAALANERARTAQIIEGIRQLRDLDVFAVASVQEIIDKENNATWFCKGAMASWAEYASSWKEERRPQRFMGLDREQLQSLASQRDELKKILVTLRGGHA